MRLLSDAREQLKSDFKALAASALDSNNASFLQLAKTVLKTSQTEAVGELAQKEQAVRNLVEPITQSLAGMNLQIQELEKSRSHAYGALTTQVQSLLETQKALQSETGNLVKALREPQARGRWGELQLRTVLELSGMMQHCDFKEQLSFNDDERRYRPDVIVDLPGGKQVVVDAKVPLSAYLAAMEATDDAMRNSPDDRSCSPGAAAHRFAGQPELLVASAVHAGVRRHVPAGRGLLPRGDGCRC